MPVGVQQKPGGARSLSPELRNHMRNTLEFVIQDFGPGL